jgi:hypothetical protein
MRILHAATGGNGTRGLAVTVAPPHFSGAAVTMCPLVLEKHAAECVSSVCVRLHECCARVHADHRAKQNRSSGASSCLSRTAHTSTLETPQPPADALNDGKGTRTPAERQNALKRLLMRPPGFPRARYMRAIFCGRGWFSVSFWGSSVEILWGSGF